MSLPERPDRRTFVMLTGLAILGVGLGGCGFQPLYGEAGTTHAAQDSLAQIEIAPIEERVGQQVRNELIRLLTPAGEPYNATYLLTISIIVQERDVFRRDTREVNRKTLTLTATYKLIDKSTRGSTDPAAPEIVVYSNTTFAEASFNRFESEFANIRARIDAENVAAAEVAKRIQTQLQAAIVSGRA